MILNESCVGHEYFHDLGAIRRIVLAPYPDCFSEWRLRTLRWTAQAMAYHSIAMETFTCVNTMVGNVKNALDFSLVGR